MSDDGRVILTPEKAEEMLPNEEHIHTFRQSGPILLGADWEKSELIDAFSKYPVELSGEEATAMGHGIVFRDEFGFVFVQTSQQVNAGIESRN